MPSSSRSCRRRLASLAAVTAVAVLSFLGAACGSGDPSVTIAVTDGSRSATPEGASARPSAAPGVPTVTPVPEPVVVIAAVGDLMLGRSVGWRIAAGEPGIPFGSVAPLLEADLTVGNLEAPIADSGSPAAKAYAFRAPTSAARILAEAGFDVVALANNHALDHGPEALLQTLDLLAAAGVHGVGAGPDAAAAHRPLIVERQGLRLAFLAYVDTPPEGTYRRETWEAAEGKPGVAWLDLARLREDVSRAKGLADNVIVFFHWGIEGSTEPSEAQRTVAEAALAAGATLVLGSHPHLLQPVEEREGRLVAFSLGNFVFDGFEGQANRSAVLRIVLDRRGVQEWKLVPVHIVDGVPFPAE
ncbi:Capsule biosynthesis protein CapA [bacterium HR29]|jgi:poly-gamma-glutamate capsule biosynthesis protein CapA/YwtB (metallophosphatase superfamily)|nr:Capsule biosynthesis protein CapA [bacterium HR29]